MPSRREQIAMTPSEVRAYLREQRRIILVTNGVDGMPHVVPMNYGMDDLDRILITSFRKSQKVKNLERDPRATLLVESGTTYREMRSVMAYCGAEIIDDPSVVPEVIREIRSAGAMAASFSESMSGQLRASIAKRVVVRFTPFRVVSWDHAKLGGVY